MTQEPFWMGVEASVLYISTLSIPLKSLNQTSLQGLRLIHPDQKLLYLFTQTLVFLKVNQYKSECVLIHMHAHIGFCLVGVDGRADNNGALFSNVTFYLSHSSAELMNKIVASSIKGSFHSAASAPPKQIPL